ncbi:CFEM domain-containing protein [Mycena venus]|uniref:CFEM domain-containing protein n=1 Tax=Mycena venus TaxID=2733690 RepID=A0A8H6YEM3_9AGAR|nr:CFEM domain-containing protein [Mycena venus]
MLPPSLASPSTQSPSNRRQRRQRRLNSASLMEGLPGTIITTRYPTLSKCVATCHNAAGAAICPDLATTCQCTNANFRFDFLSCVQGECQAAELDNAQQFVASVCGTVSLTAKPTATIPFLPTNANADINEPSHTSVSLSSHAPAQTSQETGSPNTGSTQNVDRNGAPAGTIVASVVIVVLIVALVTFVWWWIRRRRQRIRERRFPAQFLESAPPVQRVVRSPSIIKVAAAMDVETQAEVAGTTMAQGVALDETHPEKGVPAGTHNLRLTNFSDVPTEENAAQTSNAQDARHAEEAVTVRLRRVEAQLAALLTPAVESPEELPPSYWG